MPHRSPARRPAAEPVLAKRLGRELRVCDEHAEVVPVPEVFERLCGIFDRQLRDFWPREDVGVY